MEDLSQEPIHPGEVLGEVYMKSLQPSVTVGDLADSIAVSPQELALFIAAQRPVTMALAAKLAMKFRTTPEYWLGLQEQYDRRLRAGAAHRASHLKRRR